MEIPSENSINMSLSSSSSFVLVISNIEAVSCSVRVARLATTKSLTVIRERELKNIDGELKSLQESWKDLMKKNPKCPTCGSILDERHLEGFHD